MKNSKTLTITLSALAFLVLSAGVVYAASEEGFGRFSKLSDEQKEILEEARELRENGDFEAARELIENSEIDLPRRGPGPASEEMMKNRDDIREAIENADYETFLELTENSPREIVMSEETFNKLVEAHSLRVDGDFEGAREIMDEIGWGGPKEGGRGQGRENGQCQNQD